MIQCVFLFYFVFFKLTKSRSIKVTRYFCWHWCIFGTWKQSIKMAFCNKVGGLLRLSVSQNGQAPIASMLNSVRYMSSSKLFVGGIAKSLL